MSKTKAKAAVRRARDLLGNAVQRRQPASFDTGRRVFDQLALAIEEEAVSKSSDPVIIIELMRAATEMYHFAGATTKKRRLRAQWSAWVVLHEMLGDM